jgi:hypothetical protein
MIKRHIPLLLVGLVLGLALAVLSSVAMAQGPSDSRGGLDVCTISAASYVERKEFIEPSAGRVARHVMSIEPIQLQAAEGTAAEARVLLTIPLHNEARAVEHNYATQRVRHGSKVLVRQAIDEAYPIPLSVSTRDLAGAITWTAAECVVISPADSGPGTLRQCLENAVTGVTITFDAGIFPPTSPVTISLSSALPWIITDTLTIDASDAGVILSGSGLSTGTGFVVVGADGVKIRGLQIVHFPLDGVAIVGGATNTTIGGDRDTGRGPLGQGNLISGNGDDGIHIWDLGTSDNLVQGNFIGTNVSGTTAFGNLDSGIVIGPGASKNVIGGITQGRGNLISGNKVDGVLLWGLGTTGNQLLGNFVGTNFAGTSALGNLRMGVFIGFEASTNTVECNLISGNENNGILLQDQGTTGNQVLGNYIGTDVLGTKAIGNLLSGIAITFGASNNVIGGYTSRAGNLISGNEDDGIHIQNVGTIDNQIMGNSIGTNLSGTVPLGNLRSGVSIFGGASSNFIGGVTTGARNLISGNERAGIWLEGAGTTSNTVQGNFIGTDVNGIVALGNLDSGIVIYRGASSNFIGGVTTGARNLISGNEGAGIWLEGTGTTSNTVQGNFIGADVNGMAALGNLEHGIVVGFGASNNVIGGTMDGVRNLVSGNRRAGIWIGATGTTRNQVLGNLIGTDAGGTVALGNSLAGIFIGFGAASNIIGGQSPATGNCIGGNGDNGILIGSTGTTGNWILGNFIGTDRSGEIALDNSPNGVLICEAASNNLIGGETILAGNFIAFNDGHGVSVDGGQTLGNTISHNSIYSNGSLGIETANGGNDELASPTITTVISTSISGQAQPGHIIELFLDDGDEGQWFEGGVTADMDGSFRIVRSGSFRGKKVTATATDGDGNTSEFSSPVPVPFGGWKKIFLPIVVQGSG